jgi:hypothetical protein
MNSEEKTPNPLGELYGKYGFTSFGSQLQGLDKILRASPSSSP